MKVLELMWSLEEAYDRFGDIEVNIEATFSPCSSTLESKSPIKEIIIESEEVIIKCD